MAVPGEARTWRRLAALLLGTAIVAIQALAMLPAGLGRAASLRLVLVVAAAWAVVFAAVVAVDRALPFARDAWAPRVGAHVLLTAPAVLLFVGILGWVGGRAELAVPGGVWWGMPAVAYWALAGLHLGLDYHEQIHLRGVRTLELERLLAQSRIETLRTQLNPHFLFNALNAVSAHVEGAPRTARWMLEQLGDLLRLSLDHADEQEIPLQQELAFIDRYLKLQKIRFDNRLDVIVDVEPPALRAMVPTFILQPLLENAIRHGIARSSSAGLIEIQAWHENGSLHLSVRDDGPGLPPDWDPERGIGVGLSNTQERLRRLYGEDQTFGIATVEGSGVRVDLTLPYRQ